MKIFIFSNFLVLTMMMSGCGKTENSELPDKESGKSGLFDVEVGKTFTIQPLSEYQDESPTLEYGFRVPIPDNSPINFLADFEVYVNKENKLVSFISARRAFDDPKSCSEALDLLSTLAKQKYSLENVKESPSSFVVESGDILIEIHCTIPSGSPYYELSFVLSSKAQSALRDKQWETKVQEMQNALKK